MNLFRSLALFILVMLCSNPFLAGQSISAGTELGGGVITSNSPTVGSFTSSFFIEGGISAEEYIGLRLNFQYTRDFAILLPGDKSDYYPFIKCIGLKFIHSAEVYNRIYFEQGLGIITLNDRVYSDRDSWGYGISFSLLAGKDLRNTANSGFKLGVGTDYGLTFITVDAYYLTVFAHVDYTF